MDNIISYIENVDTVKILLITLISAAIFFSVLAILLIFSGFSDPERRRLYHVLGRSSASNSFENSQIEKLLKSAEPFITPKNVIERSQLQEKLIHAGYRSPDSLMYFYAIKTILLFLLPIIAFVSTTLFQNLDTKTTMYVILFAAALGLFSPNYYLHKKITTRQELVIDAFPDALDLLVVCTEAGLGLNAALQRVGQELIHNHPLLASELILVNAETRAGVDRIEALMGLARRTGIEDIKGLVSLLGQSISMGSSIAETLRIYAEDFRDKRMQRAEELAAKLGTKMLFPMMICFFPGIFIVAVGPAVLKLITVFGSH